MMNFNRAYRSILESNSNSLTPLLVNPEDYSRVFISDRHTVLPIIKPNKNYNVSNHNFFINTSNEDNISGVRPNTPLFNEITSTWERLPAVKGFYLKNRDASNGPIRTMLSEDDKDCLFIVNDDIIEHYEKIFKKNTVGGITEYEVNGYIESGIFNTPQNYFPVNYDYFEPTLGDLDSDTRDTFIDMFNSLWEIKL